MSGRSAGGSDLRDPVVEQVHDVIRANAGVVEAERLLVLCSGGRDSLCLLAAIVAVRGPAGVTALHVDHGLRAGSAAEAEGVRAQAGRLGVGVLLATAGRAPATGNVHAWARDERARLRDAALDELGASAACTAHTRSDVVEGALFRLATQPGVRALAPMASRVERPDGRALLRPLLSLSRSSTGAYCRARGLRWSDDPSNAARRFSRARVRYEVGPVLGALNPRYEEAVVRTLAELDEQQAATIALVRRELDRATGSDGVSLAALADLPAALGRLALRELVEASLGRPCPQAARRFDELVELARGPAPVALDVGGGARVVVRRGLVRCEPSDGPAAPGGAP